MKKRIVNILLVFVFLCTTLLSIPKNAEASRNEYYMDRENARNFIAFICNARTSQLSDDFFENNKFYRLLVGDLADNPMLEYNVKSEFLGYALTQIDEYIQKSGSAASETRDNLVEFFSERYIGEIQGLATSPIEETVSWGLGVIWEYGEEVADSLSTLVSFAQDPDRFTDDLKMIMNGITYLYASEVNKVYTYFDTALAWADNNDTVYNTAMDSIESMMILSGDYDGSNLAVLIPGMDSWTDWVEPIKYWAKYVYNMSCEVISGPPIYTITYITNSPFDGDYSVTYDTNESPDYPELYRDGYVFGGWFTDASCTKSASQSARSNQTWYAKWTPLYEFNISNGEVTITKFKYYKVIDDIPITNIVLPDYIDGYPVTKIGDSAFKNLLDLTGVTLGRNVKYIGDSAFNGCSKLKSANLNYNLLTIGASAFNGCSELSYMYVPDTVTSIGYASFGKCNNLTEITLPFVGSRRGISGTADSVFGHIFGYDYNLVLDKKYQYYNSSESKAFSISQKIKKVTITNETVIPYGAFYNCSDIEQLYILANASIEEYAFYNCSSLTNIALPSNITRIGDSMFYGCKNLTNVSIPNDVTNIGTNAFYNCENLTNISIPDGVTNIGANAFYNCKLINVTIPQNISSIGSNAFNIPTLSSINVDSKNQFFSSADGILFNKNKTILLRYPSAKSTKTYIIPNTVTAIESHAFDRSKNLTDIIISNAVSTVGNNAFDDCSSLSNVSLGTGLQSIGHYAFSRCSSLKYVTIPDSVTYLGGATFYNCTNLAEIVLSNNLADVNASTFNRCTNLEYITIPDSVKSIDDNAFSSSGIKDIVIPDSVTYIGESAFSNCKSLESITIGNGVSEIGIYTFSGCDKLKKLVLGDNITYMHSPCFGGCNSLEELTLPDSLLSFTEDMGSDIAPITACGLPNLKKLNIGKRLTHLGGELHYLSSTESLPFLPSSRLEYANVDPENEYMCSIDGIVYSKDKSRIILYPPYHKAEYYKIPEGIKSIGLTTNSNLKRLVFPGSFSALDGEYQKLNCENLESVYLGKNITKINTYYFGEKVDNLKIYYEGSEKDWNNICFDIYYSVNPLANLTKIFNCSYFSETTAITYDGKTTTAYITPKEEHKGKTIVFATYDYDTNKLTYSDKAVFNGSEIQFTTESKYDEIKIFVWDSLKGLTPSCKAEVISAKDW